MWACLKYIETGPLVLKKILCSANIFSGSYYGVERKNMENNIGKDDIKKLVIRLALPSMLAQFVSVLYSIVDRMYIGNIPGIGDISLAGVGICGPIVTLLTAISALIGMGGAPVFSINLGEGNKEYAKKIMANCFIMLIFSSLLVTAAIFPVKEWILTAFGADKEILPYADEYFSFYIIGTVFAVTGVGMNQFIICQGFSKAAMISVMIGAAVNIALDPLFIFTFGLGVKGAAIATVISQIISFAYTVIFLTGRKIQVPLSIGGYSLKICKKVLSVGLTPFIIIAFDNIIIIAMNATLKIYGGAESQMLLTCSAILQSFMLVITMPLGGITGGTQTILGYNYGARNSKRVKEGEKYIVLLSLIFVTVMFVISQTLSRYFVCLFTQNEEYIDFTVKLIKMYTLGVIPLGLQYSFVDSFTGMGIVRVSITLSCFRKLIFLLCVFIAPLITDVKYIFTAEPISDIISAAVSTAVYFLLIDKILIKRENSYS